MWWILILLFILSTITVYLKGKWGLLWFLIPLFFLAITYSIMETGRGWGAVFGFIVFLVITIYSAIAVALGILVGYILRYVFR